jgi:peptidoglycan/LPS O-acetylase OafA/YrhL
MTSLAPSSVSGTGRVPALDGLRAVAIAAVILFHYKNSLFPGGFVGVDLFFVISGYVVTRSLRDEFASSGRIGIGSFYVRRARRILPALLVAIVGTLILEWLTDGLSRSDWHATLAVVASAFNWFLAWQHLYDSAFVHIWSLSLEEQFYLLWPLAFLILLRARRKFLARAVPAGLIAASVLWSFYLVQDGATWHRVYFGSDSRAHGILAGCLLGVAGRGASPKVLVRLWPMPAIAFVAMALTLNNHASYMGLWGFALATAMSLWLVAAALEAGEGPLRDVLSSPPAQWLGLRSYSLFLWHFPVAQALHALGVPAWPLFALAASLLIADLSYRFVELPFMRGRREKLDRRAAAEAQAGP